MKKTNQLLQNILQILHLMKFNLKNCGHGLFTLSFCVCNVAMGSRSRNQTQTWTLGVNKTTDAIHTTRHVDILRRYIFWCCAGNQSVDAVTSHQLPACHPRLIVVEQLDSAPANRIGILPHCRIPPCSGCRSADKIYWSQTFELKYRYHFIILTRIRGKIFSK